MPSKRAAASGTSMGRQIHLQGFCNRPASLLGHGHLLFQDALALLGGLPTMISPGPLAPAGGLLAFDCPATTPAGC
jgi:hypothetical protein